MVRARKNLVPQTCRGGRHTWDFSTTLWHDGLRKHPCKKCSENLVIGTVRIQEAKP